VRVSRDREHRFQMIVSRDFAGSWARISVDREQRFQRSWAPVSRCL